MIKALRWPFKNFVNFSITAVGIFGLTFWGYSTYSQTKFNQPIIHESIKTLGKHKNIKELVDNRFVQRQNQSYYSFKVNGPKSNVNVEMTVQSQPAQKIYGYGQPNQRLDTLRTKYQQHKNSIEDIQKQMKMKGVNKKKMNELLLQKADQQSKMKAYQNEIAQANYDIYDKKKRYYVPNKQIYSTLNDPRALQKTQIFPKDSLLSGIQDMVITLPNRTKMIVYPQGKKTTQQKKEILKVQEYPQTPTMASLSSRMIVNLSEFSKEEIEAYGKQKTQFMYSKYGNYRMISIILFGGLVASAVLYKRNNVIRSIKGSILETNIKTMLNSNKHIDQLLKARNKKQAQYEELIGGGITNDKFDCVLYLRSVTNGRVEVAGKFREDLGIYQFEKMRLKYREGKEKKQIDLLL